MANNYSQATLSPYGLVLTEGQKTWLACTGASFEVASKRPKDCLDVSDDRKGECVFWETNFQECPDEDDLIYKVEDEDEPEKAVARLVEMGGIEDVLRSILKNPGNQGIPSLRIDGAATCSRMRSGEFGGFVLVVTRKEFVWANTFSVDLENGQLKHPTKVIPFDE